VVSSICLDTLRVPVGARGGAVAEALLYKS
jgi:hypothetical protein